MINPDLSVVPTAEEISSQLELLTCEHCMKGDLLPFEFSFAFQPNSFSIFEASMAYLKSWPGRSFTKVICSL